MVCCFYTRCPQEVAILRKYRWFIVVLIVLLVSMVGYFGYVVYGDLTSDEQNEEVENESEQEDQEKQVTELSEEKFENYDEAGLNPFGDTVEQNELGNNHFKEYIHQMSHQKVEADEKWGFYLITEERINWLLSGLDEVDLGDSDSEAIYKAILKRWGDGNFSQVDQDHNTIWRLQGGTIGKATGVLSQEEEEEFINSKQ